MRKLRLIFAFLPICLLSCSFKIEYSRYAVVYGISDYQGSANLDYCDDDAYSMYELLQNLGYKVYLKIDSSATRANLLDDFEGIKDKAEPDDLFLFYFSGHGGQMFTGSSQSNEMPEVNDSFDEWIFLYGSITDTNINFSETFNDDQLGDAFDSIPCDKKIIILDSCNSGGFIGNTLEADGIPQLYEGDTYSRADNLESAIKLYTNFTGDSFDISPYDALVISAAGEQEFSWEAYSYGHGVFTFFLLESAEKGDRNNDGFVTVLEAYAYIRNGIERNWNSDLDPYFEESEWIFSPHVSGGPVDFVLF